MYALKGTFIRSCIALFKCQRSHTKTCVIRNVQLHERGLLNSTQFRNAQPASPTFFEVFYSSLKTPSTKYPKNKHLELSKFIQKNCKRSSHFIYSFIRARFGLAVHGFSANYIRNPL